MIPLYERELDRAQRGTDDFSGSPRTPARMSAPEHAADPGEGRRHHGEAYPTYRTLCVRLCDGYYFPISFSTRRRQLTKDARACEKHCSSEARLFVHRNPGGDVEDMKDLKGRSYSELKTAFLYRTEYLPDCKCQPHPWEKEAIERHRGYAMAAAPDNGGGQRTVEPSHSHQMLNGRREKRIAHRQRWRHLTSSGEVRRTSSESSAGEGSAGSTRGNYFGTIDSGR
jgi:hypothetical protein